MKHSFAQVPLPLRLGHFVACFSHGAQLRSSTSPTGTQQPCSLLLTWSTASLKCLSHWDSAILQLAPPMEHSFAQVPLPLGLGYLTACSFHRAQLRSSTFSLELGHLAACSSYGAQLSSSTSPTGTRLPCSLLLLWSTTSLKCLSHLDSATL
ncbi:hypothetical protein Adt_20059 [Abeliophyllum distichum]|uniref:Uncharacterized protein n=1 Tax=Abeliophyllum distichum TaxID=126358 RepID=A0ABD1SUN8_9LAMI